MYTVLVKAADCRIGGVFVNINIDLIQAAKQGDAQSFTALYEKVAPALYRTALYTLGNSYDAEDVVSETFMETFHGIAKLRDEKAFCPWIHKILSARCKRKIKEYIKGRQTFDIDSMIDLDDGKDMGENAFQRVDLLRALEQLSLQERQIVLLSVLEGYTTKEIAHILTCPHGTVSSKLYRALKKMRKVIENEE